MKWKEMFRGRQREIETRAVVDTSRPRPSAVALDSLDGCVGGRLEADDVGCYLRSTQPGTH